MALWEEVYWGSVNNKRADFVAENFSNEKPNTQPSACSAQDEASSRNGLWETLSRKTSDFIDTGMPATHSAEQPYADSNYSTIVSRGEVPAYPAILQAMLSDLDALWLNILLRTKKTPSTLLFCSAKTAEGTTFTSFHISLFLAAVHNLKTLYVDTNRHFLKSHPILTNLHNYQGLHAYFKFNQPLSSLVLRTEYDNLFVLPSGLNKSTEYLKHTMLQKEALGNLVNYCRTYYDITIFDSQSILLNPDMIQLAQVADAVIVVCRYGKSRRETSRLAIDTLFKYGVQVLGVVLNERKYPVTFSSDTHLP